MSKRGLSHHEKRAKLVELFHETHWLAGEWLQKDFYTLKELEKLAPKSKGIISNSVKEVLQSLCDDNLVSFDKIGTSNYYWSFPGAAAAQVKTQLAAREDELAQLRARAAELKASIADGQAARPESITSPSSPSPSEPLGSTPSRTEMVAQLKALQAELRTLDDELAQWTGSDPAALDMKRWAVATAKAEAIRLTEATSLAIATLADRAGVERSDVRQALGIDEAWEDIS